MNSHTVNLPQGFTEVLRSIPEREIKSVFDQMRMAEYNSLTTIPREQLTDVPARVRLLNEVEAYFTEVNKKPVNTLKPNQNPQSK